MTDYEDRGRVTRIENDGERVQGSAEKIAQFDPWTPAALRIMHGDHRPGWEE